jgi:acetyltransferase-like isoleucine patch superfamily enzyme
MSSCCQTDDADEAIGRFIAVSPGPAYPPPRRSAVSSFVDRRLHGIVNRLWDRIVRIGAIGPLSVRARRFGHFGEGSIICFPATTIYNEEYIHIGRDTMIGPGCSLSAGMVPGQKMLNDRVVTIGDRCLIGKGSGIVGHFSIEIGDDVWTGHHVYITDQNHDYRDVSRPISRQSMPEQPVRIGNGSWIGFGSVVLPGADIGEHVVIGANSVVAGPIPSYSVAVGAPARVVRYFSDGEWRSVDES